MTPFKLTEVRRTLLRIVEKGTRLPTHISLRVRLQVEVIRKGSTKPEKTMVHVEVFALPQPRE